MRALIQAYAQLVYKWLIGQAREGIVIEDAPCLSKNDFDSAVLDEFGTYFF